MARKYSLQECERILNIDDPDVLDREEREIYDSCYGENDEDENDNVEANDDEEDEIQLQDENSAAAESSGESDDEETTSEKYLSKSGMEWFSTPFRAGKRPICNILTEPCGLANNSRNVTTVAESFLLYLPNRALDIICKYTNAAAQRAYNIYNEKYPDKLKNWRCTDHVEMKAFLGILIAAGNVHGNDINIAELWNSHPAFRNPIFTATMSRTRFQLLCAFIRFDNPLTRQERIANTHDKLEAIREIYDIFAEECVSNYKPSPNLTIDERLATYRGKCPFRVYIKSKPGRYGIKIWVCADSDTAYICNLQVYTGMKNNQREVNQGMRVVSELAAPYYNSGRGITTDNFFTSIPLANLLLEKKLTLVGTLRANKREIPQQFLPNKNRDTHTSIFGFTKDITLVSYVTKKAAAVILLSTQHHAATIIEDNDKKPEIITHYNETKGGVDTGDMMTRKYSCVRMTHRWPFRLFMELVDMAALNAYIIWTIKNPDWQKDNPRKRSEFLQSLVLELVTPYIEIRAQNSHGLQKPIINAMSAVGITVPKPQGRLQKGQSSKMCSGRRCAYCPKNKDRKTRYMCFHCKKAVCVEHRTDNTISTCLYCKQ